MGKTRAAPQPKAAQKALAKAFVKDLAAKGRPKIQVDNRGQFAATFHDPKADFDWGATPLFIAQALAWLDEEGMVKRLEAEIDLMPDAPLALSKTAQGKRLSELTAELDGLERREEALVASAALAGQDVLRRPDASPSAVLGVKVVRVAAMAA